MSRGWLASALEAAGLPAARQFPRDLAGDAAVHLPVVIELISDLSSGCVRAWLGQRGIQHRVSEIDRRLHGCLVARSGRGIVFLDREDNDAERRFTLAHEIAHFVLDHQLPRLKALKILGERIVPVLDGQRAPSQEELLSAVLQRVPLDVQVHLMSRSATGAICTWDIEESEQRADRLALELLAPAQTAVAELRHILTDTEEVDGQVNRAADHLAFRFGLPTAVATTYVQQLLGKRRKTLTLTEEIFGRE